MNITLMIIVGLVIGAISGTITMNSLFNKSCLGVIIGLGMLLAWILIVIFVL